MLTFNFIESQIFFQHELVLLSDEVYQDNTYDPSRPFVSFHKVLHSMPDPISSVPLVCFHSISKGFTGECGLRGGYMALSNFGPDVLQQVRLLYSRTILLTSTHFLSLSSFTKSLRSVCARMWLDNWRSVYQSIHQSPVMPHSNCIKKRKWRSKIIFEGVLRKLFRH